MFRQSFYTFFNRFFIAVVNFLTIIITARYLGAEGRGVISLFLLNLTITSMISSFVGGPGLVYLVPRHNASQLLNASYIWAIFTGIVSSLVLYFFHLVDGNLLMHLLLLSIMQSVLRIQMLYLLAIEKIKEYNFLALIYPVVLFVTLIYFFAIKKNANMGEYFNSFYISTIAAIFASTIIVYKNIAWNFSFDLKNIFSHAFKLGFIIQCANILQLLNYRFSFFLLDHFFGKHMVGVYSTANSIAEGVWIIAGSFATIQYSKIANSKNDENNKILTLQITKIVFLLTFAAVVVLLLLPQELFVWMFGKDFGELKNIFPYFAPGILLLIYSIAISHYYSGSGNPKMGLIGSAAGFVVTAVAGIILIPQFELQGAALTATLSYSTSSLVLLVIFSKQKKLSAADFFPNRNSFKFLKLK